MLNLPHYYHNGGIWPFIGGFYVAALVKAGRLKEAQECHRRLFPLCRDMLGVATNPIPIKTALKLLGRGNGELRLPMCPLDAAGETKVKQSLVNYGLLRM